MITNGVVSIEDGTKAAEEFAPARKVRVELTFAVDESEDAQRKLDYVSQVANQQVKHLLGKAVDPVKQPETEVVKKERKPRAAKEAKEVVVDASPAGSDKAKLEEAAGLKPAEPAQAEEDSLDDLLGEAAPVPITDAELAKAAQNKNAQMKAKDPNFSVKIRALVVEYAGQPPKKITDVPVAKRQEFLDKLRDLT